MDAAEALATQRAQRCSFFQPAMERELIQPRHAAVRMEAEQAVGDAAQGRRLQDGIVEPRSQGGEPRAVGKMRNHSRTQRHAIRVMIMLQELGLEPGHIDAGRALGLARLAGQAEVHDLLDFVAVEGTLRIGRCGKDLTQDIGTGTCGVFLLAGRHVARAHRATGQRPFAAVAEAITFFSRAHHTLHVTEIEDRVILRSPLPRAVAQRGIHRRRVDYLAGIENIHRVEGRFDLTHELVAMLADH